MNCLLLCLSLLSLALALPQRPEFPVDELCEEYRRKCESHHKNTKCKERSVECLDYASKGLDTAWSFCMFAQESNIEYCTERLNTDYSQIERAVKADAFKYDF